MARLDYYDALEREAGNEWSEKPPDSDVTRMIATMKKAAQDAPWITCNTRRQKMRETILDGTGEDVPGHRILDGSDLEIAYNRSGGNLILRVNKGPCQVFRVMLVDVFKNISDRKRFGFNSVSPEFVFKIGDVREGLMAMGRSVGLTPEQMQKLEAKAREIAP